MLRIAIVGLPGSGKTSLFRALTSAAVAGAPGKKEIHVGQAKVPDRRLDQLHRWFDGREVHALVEYVDSAGFGGGAAPRSAFDDRMLGELRSCDALMQTLRHFPAPGMSAPQPVRDFHTADQEFMLSDHVILEGRLHRLRKDFSKLPDRAAASREIELLERCLKSLADGQPLRRVGISPEEAALLRSYQPLSLKPQLAVLNVAEEDIRREAGLLDQYRPEIESAGAELTAVCASIEMEIAQLDAASAGEFMQDLGITESALDRVIRASYHLLGMISFFTIGRDECRAWAVRRNALAREAAGAVHSDMERGFIRAEVVHFDDLAACDGSIAACRSQGLMRTEGKDYPMQDGDVIEFRFAV